MVALSWLGAIIACLGYGVASVLQSVAAKRASRSRGADRAGLDHQARAVSGGIGLPALGFAGMWWLCSDFRCSWFSHRRRKCWVTAVIGQSARCTPVL